MDSKFQFHSAKISFTFFTLIIIAAAFFTACGSSPETQIEENIIKRENIAEESDHQKVKVKNQKTKIVLNDEDSDDSYIVIRKGTRGDIDSVRFDMRNLKKELDEMFEELNNINIHVDFDAEELRESLSKIKINVNIDSAVTEGLKGLDEELVRVKIRKSDSLTSFIDEEELREIRMHFNSKEFKEEMENLEKELEEAREELADMNIEIEVMNQDLASDARKLSEEILENFDFDIDIQIDKEKLEKDLKRAKEEIESLDIDLDKIDEFSEEITGNLVNDGLLDDPDEGYTLKFDNEDVFLDGEKITEKISQKYRKIFFEYFNKYPEEEKIIKR